MTNRVGSYFASGNNRGVDIARASVALAFCRAITRIYAQGGEYSSRVKNELANVETEAMEVFRHYRVRLPRIH
jgi:hypothetical protein